MTPAAVAQLKGNPIKKDEPKRWFYNSIDAAHNGIIEVNFDPIAATHSSQVGAILFYGENNAAPPGLPNLNRLTREELVSRYGEPTWDPPRNSDYYVGFRNGILVELVSGKANGYGLYVPREDP